MEHHARDLLEEIMSLVDYESGAGPLIHAYVRGEIEEVHVSEDLAYLLMEARDLFIED